MGYGNDIKRKVRWAYLSLRTLLQPTFQSSIWSGKRGDPSSLRYLEEFESPRNQYLYDVLDSIKFNFLVELGSNMGPKLFSFARDNPGINVLGLDINRQAVVKGNEIAESLGRGNLSFKHFDLVKDDLGSLSIDLNVAVVFSWATLIYIHPVDIVKSLQQILKENPAGFIFIEQQDTDLNFLSKRGKLIDGGPNYVRDYVYLLEKLDTGKHYSITTSTVPEYIWNPGGGMARLIVGRRLPLILDC